MAEIFFSPITQVLNNRSPGILIAGSPGSGKTFAMLNMAAGVLEQGCNIFALDAKNDMLALKNIFPDIKTTDVNNIAPGSLDPFLVFSDVDSTIILTIVEILCGDLTSPQKLAITPIIGDFVKRVKLLNGSTTFREFADYLYANQNPDAQLIGNQLLINSDTKYGPLIFGLPGRKSKPMSLKKENRIISIFGMTLPSGSTTPKPDELVSAAIVYIICRMMKLVLTRETDQTKISQKNLSFNQTKKEKTNKKKKTPILVILDECHMLMRSEAIKDVIDELLVLGRSLGVSVCMASQNVTHFDPDIAQHVASKFSFRMSKKEAEEFFNLFDNSSSGNELDVAECIECTTRLKTGYCFFIDSKERCTLMHVTSPYDQGDLTSNPLLKKR